MRRGIFLRGLLAFLAIILLFYTAFVFASDTQLSGVISLIVLGHGINFDIQSPENITYFFAKYQPYTIGLNVTTNSSVEGWSYDLKDLRHNVFVVRGLTFNPNITFNASRWSNLITVYANNSQGDYSSKSVQFFVSVPNSAPIIQDLPDSLFVCEGSYLHQSFQAFDIDEDAISYDLNPKNPIFITTTPTSSQTITNLYLFSGVLSKKDIKNYSEIVSISDGQYSDTGNVNVTVIEINNPPTLEEIGAQTININDKPSIFYKEVKANDVESGNQSSGNLKFNVTFIIGTPFFNISSDGIINTNVSADNLGTYLVQVCVTDQPLINPNQNISLCGQTGGSMTTCNDFMLSIVNTNRPPTITSFFPISKNINVKGEEAIAFNITTYDPDGAAPDAYWYVDSSLKAYQSGVINSFSQSSNSLNTFQNNFTYTFSCNSPGNHTVFVNVTDGLAWDSVEWNVKVNETICPSAPPSGSSGGGGSVGFACAPQWACRDWNVCKNTANGLETGLLFGEDYRIIEQICNNESLDSNSCGFQTRDCTDLNSCNRTLTKPDVVRQCQFSENPTCSDGIKNCHDGSCETLIDCGGSCNACATCSDGIKNQGETGIDCGGPCPWACVAHPFYSPLVSNANYFLYVLGIILAIIIIYQIYRIRKIRKKLLETKK